MDTSWDWMSVLAVIWLVGFPLSVIIGLLGLLIEEKTELTLLGERIRVIGSYSGITLLLVAFPLLGIILWKGSEKDWHTLGCLGFFLLVLIGNGISLSGWPPGQGK